MGGPLYHPRLLGGRSLPGGGGCRCSSVVERTLGKGEAVSSILTSGFQLESVEVWRQEEGSGHIVPPWAPRRRPFIEASGMSLSPQHSSAHT